MRAATIQAIVNAALTLGLAVFVTSMMMLISSLGTLEGKYFPVVGSFKIRNMRDIDDTKVSVSLQFTKLRTCVRKSFHGYVLDKEGSWKYVSIIDPVDYRQEHSLVKPQGTYITEWYFTLTQSERNNALLLKTEHYCWGSHLWTTSTVVLIPPRPPILSNTPNATT